MSVMDILAHHFPRSIFKKLNPQWWNPKKSWKNVYVDWDKGIKKYKFTIFPDAWHTFKYLMILFFIASIMSCPYEIIDLDFNGVEILLIIEFLLLFFLYLAVYKVFYHIILRNEKKS
jgi:hypothetical protein